MTRFFFVCVSRLGLDRDHAVFHRQIVRLFYDVADRRFVRNTERVAPGLLDGMTCWLPAMHAKMHAASCRALCDGVFAEGGGYPNSENNEQENRRLGQVRPLRLVNFFCVALTGTMCATLRPWSRSLKRLVRRRHPWRRPAG